MGLSADNSLEIGAFGRIWRGAEVTEIARRMAACGLQCCQWNFSAIGKPTVWGDIGQADCESVRRTFEQHGIRIWGLSCTYNIIDPDVTRRQENTRAAMAMIAKAPALGVEAVTICTGSADPDDMWRWHPDNDSDQAWTDALAAMRQLLEVAANAGVLIGVEPEGGNVVSTAARAARLRDELGTDAPLGFIIDIANLVSQDRLSEQTRIIDDAFGLLGPRTIAVHAKDLIDGCPVAPGAGDLDFTRIASAHRRHSPSAPVIIQDTEPHDVRPVADFLRRTWEQVEAPA